MNAAERIEEAAKMFADHDPDSLEAAEAFGRLLEIARSLDGMSDYLDVELAKTKAQLEKRDEQLLRVVGFKFALGESEESE